MVLGQVVTMLLTLPALNTLRTNMTMPSPGEMAARFLLAMMGWVRALVHRVLSTLRFMDRVTMTSRYVVMEVMCEVSGCRWVRVTNVVMMVS